jgi:S-methyl-5-thioribose-1-phosphate isomerase
MVHAGDAAIEWRHDRIVCIDQTALPHEVRRIQLTTVDELIDAIVRLAIRGAPMLGAAGAYGVVLAAVQADRSGWPAERLRAEIDRLGRARPTAVNLAWGVAAVSPALRHGTEAAETAAIEVVAGIAAANRKIGERGAAYLTARYDGSLRVHTHCNTGALACVEWGTALGVIRSLHEGGRLANVIVDETRPLLQGSRLTCWELAQLGIAHQLVPDGAGPFVLAQGLVDAVVVGADRIAANGDTANKIGTYGLALAAHRARIPFLVAAPESTIDWATATGTSIPVERRAESEITYFAGRRVTPDNTRALNFAFDITPWELISAIITERRVITDDARERASAASSTSGLMPLDRDEAVRP